MSQPYRVVYPLALALSVTLFITLTQPWQLFLVFAGCFCIRVTRHFGGGAWAEGIPMEYLLFLSVGLFCAEPSISVVTSSCLDGGHNSTKKAE